MKLKWADYDVKRDKHIDEWMDRDYSPNSGLIKQFAISALSSISEEAEEVDWRMEEKILKENYPDFVKVVRHKDETVAFIILRAMLILDFGKTVKFSGSINPLVVNPRLIGKGYGTAVIKDLIKNSKKITGLVFENFSGIANIQNERSIRMLRGLGFSETEIYKEGLIRFKRQIGKEKYGNKRALNPACVSNLYVKEKEWL